MNAKQKGFYNLNLGGFFIALILVGIVIGALLTFGLPWLWDLLRPWVHEVTR